MMGNTQLFTEYGTLSMDGLAFMQAGVMVLGFAGIIAAILYIGLKRK